MALISISFFSTSCLLLSLLFGSLPVFAQQQNQPATNVSLQIIELWREGDYQQAYQVATQHVAELEGELQFDLAYGLAASYVKQCNLAMFPLERVLFSVPDSKEARLGLAICYLQRGNTQAADYELSVLEGQALSQEWQSRIDQVRQALRQQRHQQESAISGYLSAQLGYDNNPNNGIDRDFVTIPILGQVGLADSALRQGSGAADIAAGLRYNSVIDQQSGWHIAADVRHLGFSNDNALARTSAYLTAGYTRRQATRLLSASVFMQPLWLDGDEYLRYAGVSGSVSQVMYEDMHLGLTLTAGDIEYPDIDALSRQQLSASAWLLAAQFGGQGKVSLVVGTEDTHASRFDFNSRNILGLAYQLRWSIGPNWQLRGELDFRQITFAQVHPLFNQERDDEQRVLALFANYQLTPSWQLMSKLSLQYNRSNISIYDYTRRSLWLGVRYQF